ncbi:hypothetical protein A2526_01445 [candidate division WOR-1 bacterium RIFOXYD2_FULL_36_8]|uniref:Uncharacterized protein n=1 Tax=candidate division WOR-1 bacterium RIFOXYB2_FULL_36_35 TaxID=1802578 RepID=A0A1F4S167_UNCSA|nr:MAG: hypothetical protein A2230_03545 [candidate division WOR-1 bacterium RIFOXYA2_FULL_36_21]OGC14172.1 MAG: hypothetical protein A2290_00655 [candidate division WOR-1 bacterium RIFOXYB2_FULL_36_35]OGC15394.1 MAG: hypothetical protein A2282_01645 [candidate division WOR-1 bacterium RIFOXYA12_FULL_36_13]OGC40697.1 MAG: hypothetical protein A2526_01445 [candidate division WOR-1 bacterium RIFOXYD2_FULL_36_8]
MQQAQHSFPNKNNLDFPIVPIVYYRKKNKDISGLFNDLTPIRIIGWCINSCVNCHSDESQNPFL